MLRLPGHDRYDHVNINNRKDYSWPDGKRLAMYIACNVEHFAFGIGLGADPAHRPGQNTRNYAWRDYGNRIGQWRLFELLDELKLPASILLNSIVCYYYPDLIEKIKERGDDVICHGRTTAEIHTPFWEEDEARVVRECTDIIGQHLGRRPTGWMGPAALESKVTPDLLKEAGYTHLLDWPVDDQPIWFRTRSGPLLSVPYPVELNDFGTLLARDHTGREYADMLKLIVKSILPRDEALLKAVAPHWEWIAEDGMPNVASIMAEQDFWADTFRTVENKVPQGRVIEPSIAKEAVQRLTAERPFG